MSEGNNCDKLGPHTWCWESFTLEYMAEMTTTCGTSDLYAGHEHRFVFMPTDSSWDSYITE